MPCYKPLKAVRDSDGIRFTSSAEMATIRLPCGQCIGCRLEKSRQWATRCMHEASMHRHNCFLTLTYATEHLPPNGSLQKRDHQLFLKRLRKSLSNKSGQYLASLDKKHKVRYYMAGEYGEQLARPHYHLCLFGIDLADKKPYKKTKQGNWLYTSQTIANLWPYGFNTIGELNFETAAYTARYVMKKITGKKADKHYEKLDIETGEIIKIEHEYNEMSRRPGIALHWLQKYKSDVYDALPGKVVIRGKTAYAPRYYNKQLKKWDPEKFEIINEHKRKESYKNLGDNTPKRLAVKKEVQRAKIRNLKREI